MSMTEHGISARNTRESLQDPFTIHSRLAAMSEPLPLKVVTKIDGERANEPVLWSEFCAVNVDMESELRLIRAAIDQTGVYQGGGGAAPVFTVRIAMESALDRFNQAFDYGFMLPIDNFDVSAAVEIARMRGRDDIARQLIAALAGDGGSKLNVVNIR